MQEEVSGCSYSYRNTLLAIPKGIRVQYNLYNKNNRSDPEAMSPEIQLAGIYPRSERLIELTRSHERSRTSWSQVELQTSEETKKIIDLQERLGVETVSDGALSWQDQLRPLSQCLSGIVTGTRYSRWFDTNTFYQKPIITGRISTGKIDPTNFIRVELLATEKKRKIAIPGPYTFSQLSENKHYQDYDDLLSDVANAERKIIQALRAKGISFFQLSEPCLVYQPYRRDFGKPKELQSAVRAIQTVVSDYPQDFAVQTYFGDAEPILRPLLALNVKGVGVDLFETDISKFDEKISKTVFLGAVDSRESSVEDSRWIADAARKFQEKTNPQEIVFTPNSDLKFVTQTIANEKIEALSKACQLFEES